MNEIKPSGGILLVMLLMMAVGNLFLAGCIDRVHERSLRDWVAPSADRIWSPPPGAVSEERPLERKTIDIPQDLLTPGKRWRLMDIVEVALRNNPETKSAWYAARAATADWLSKKGDYYPQIDASASGLHIDSELATVPSGNSFQPALELSWLLFDFGGRDSSIEEKRQALLAADFVHNATIQNVVFLVLQTYFQYANARALVKASEASVKEASTNLEAAQQRHQEGLATIADVLLAKTALSQAQLNLEVVQGLVQTIRGALATAMGIPANTPYDIEDLPLTPPVNTLVEEVDTYIKQAEANRPDLAAQRALVEQSMAHIRTTRSLLYPSLVLDNSLGAAISDTTSEWETQNTIALILRIPLFKGFSRRYDVLKAREDAETQKAQFHSLEQTVILQVWSSYFNLKTSAQTVKTSDDLLQSALQSYDVALGRYKEGVGGFLDLLSAQSTLETARAQRVVAQAGWYISFAQLARDTGMLWSQKPGEKGSISDLFPTTGIKER
jgi:outer membrane protein TolC